MNECAQYATIEDELLGERRESLSNRKAAAAAPKGCLGRNVESSQETTTDGNIQLVRTEKGSAVRECKKHSRLWSFMFALRIWTEFVRLDV